MTNVSHHASIVRYCSPTTVKDGIPIDNAFWIRPIEEYLSVNVLPGDLEVKAGLAHTRKILTKKRFDTNTNGRFAVFNAGCIMQFMHEYGMNIKIEHRPSPDDPTHAGIAPAERGDASARHESTRIMARALSQFLRDSPSSVYPVR